MPSTTVATPRTCPIARSLNLFGDRWSLLIIREVLYGNHRFEDFVRYTGAARDILTARLNKLIDDGFLEKRPYNSAGNRYEYHVTAAGLALRPILLALGEFSEAVVAGGDTTWRQLSVSDQ
jgi:DNA-binding HxlR family transcriptional regulator